MSRGNSPFYWITETLRFARVCAVKHPIAAPLVPVIACTALGFLSLEITNGRNGSTAAPTPTRAIRYDENRADPYAAAAAAPVEKKHKTWQAQYIQDMLDGLEHKTRTQKIEDAVDAMSHFIGRPRE